MAKSNTRRPGEVTPGFTTHEGAKAVRESAIKELTRAVSCCMLFEDTFYESGNDLAVRIKELVPKVPLSDVAALAVKARTEFKIRHASLYLALQLLSHPGKEAAPNVVGQCISEVIRRADELAEILAIWWKITPKQTKGKNAKVPRQLKAGIAKAFQKFSAYNLAKYDRQDAAVRLRDALFISHAKPKDEAQGATWKKLIDKTLESPDTWEVALSAGKEKGATFTRLIKEGKLGYMALLRNLRNMDESGVDHQLVRDALMKGVEGSMALPFRFVAAARFAPGFAQDVSDAMVKALESYPKIPGKTAIVIDVSGSMDAMLSGKSKMNRIDAAAALAVLLREVSTAKVYQFGDDCREVAAYRGIGLVDAVKDNHVGHGTNISGAVDHVLRTFKDVERIFVVTDMQSHTNVHPIPGGVKGYYINVAPYAPAMPTQGGAWTIINGWSERIIDWVMAEEELVAAPVIDE